MRSTLLLACVLIPACTDQATSGQDPPGQDTDLDGSYQVTRRVVASEPSPQFDIKQDVAITIDGRAVQVSTSTQPASEVMIAGAHLTFTDGEQWQSPEGVGAAYLRYDLQHTDGTLVGTVHATVSYHHMTGFFDFDYTLAIDGAR